MATTLVLRNAYVNSLRQELSYYGNKLATRTQQGHKPTVQKQVKFMLLQAFIEIAERYLDEYDDLKDEFMTVSEFNDIQQHINRIGNSFHWIDVS